MTVNLNDANSAFIVGIVNLLAARENWARRRLLRQAKRQKAAAGIAVTPCPVGYIAGPNRMWFKDPDPRVRQAIQRVFDTFLRLGSVGAVCRDFRTADMKLPVRPSRRGD